MCFRLCDTLPRTKLPSIIPMAVSPLKVLCTCVTSYMQNESHRDFTCGTYITVKPGMDYRNGTDV